MSQSTDQPSQQAEARTQETRSYMCQVRQVRAATSECYMPKEKIRIVLQGFRRETTVNDLGRDDRPHSQRPL